MESTRYSAIHINIYYLGIKNYMCTYKILYTCHMSSCIIFCLKRGTCSSYTCCFYKRAVPEGSVFVFRHRAIKKCLFDLWVEP